MVQEAEKYSAEDEANETKIEAKNSLENYCFTMRNALAEEEELQDKFEAGDKDKIEKAVQETLDWLDQNQLAEKDEFDFFKKTEGVGASCEPRHDKRVPSFWAPEAVGNCACANGLCTITVQCALAF
eukprot:5724975-Amphidinium_carterae.1